MDAYPVDIDPGQIVRWVMAENKTGPHRLSVRARRVLEPHDIPLREEYRLGDQERDELHDVATVATLEITPLHVVEGWRLTITVVDEAGPKLPEKGMTAESEQAIDISTFYREFIEPDRGDAEATAEVEGPDAEAHLAELLDAIGRNAPHPG